MVETIGPLRLLESRRPCDRHSIGAISAALANEKSSQCQAVGSSAATAFSELGSGMAGNRLQMRREPIEALPAWRCFEPCQRPTCRAGPSWQTYGQLRGSMCGSRRGCNRSPDELASSPIRVSVPHRSIGIIAQSQTCPRLSNAPVWTGGKRSISHRLGPCAFPAGKRLMQRRDAISTCPGTGTNSALLPIRVLAGLIAPPKPLPRGCGGTLPLQVARIERVVSPYQMVWAGWGWGVAGLISPKAPSRRNGCEAGRAGNPLKSLAPRVGFEPTTSRLTAGCSTAELPRNNQGSWQGS